MIVDLPDTTTKDVGKKLVSLRNSVGSMAMGRVLTLLVVVEEPGADEAIAVANDATRQHPARIIVVVRAGRGGTDRLDAQIRVGGDAGASEIVVLRLYGQLAEDGDSVVTPMLLPDSPIVSWWPGDPPEDVAGSALGGLAHRRITDAQHCHAPETQLERRAAHYRSGDTDLSWTRITRWRALLAAALDHPPFEEVTEATVTSEAGFPGADLLAGWLATSLDVPVTRARSRSGTGLVSVRLQRASGPVDLVRADGQVATLAQPGQPAREVALLEPGTSEALAAELRRLDADEVYARALVEGRELLEAASMTQSEAIAAGAAPAGSATVGARGGRVSTEALAERSPEESAPSSDVVAEAVQSGLQGHEGATVQVRDSAQEVARAVAEAAAARLQEAVDRRQVGHLVLTGGSMGAATVTALADHSGGQQWWGGVHLWWGDERFVAGGDPDRNDLQALEAGMDRLGVPEQQIHRVATGTDAEALPRAAADYATALAAASAPAIPGATTDGGPGVPVPRFDVLLLGMGPDSHVASLFPGREELQVQDTATVPVTASPKPPPLRVSLTVPALRAARVTYLVVTGADKAAGVAESLAATDDPQHPASWMRGTEETVWWLDAAAASDLGRR